MGRVLRHGIAAPLARPHSLRGAAFVVITARPVLESDGDLAADLAEKART